VNIFLLKHTVIENYFESIPDAQKSENLMANFFRECSFFSAYDIISHLLLKILKRNPEVSNFKQKFEIKKIAIRRDFLKNSNLL